MTLGNNMEEGMVTIKGNGIILLFFLVNFNDCDVYWCIFDIYGNIFIYDLE